jgi:hypothetical protein
MSRAGIAILLLVGLGGCGGAPGRSDPVSARAALENALEAWKGGSASRSLLDQSPPMHVADYRWEAGFRLSSYKITESSSTSGFDRRYPVELWLKSPKGKASREKAVYNISISPSLTVVRDPES